MKTSRVLSRFRTVIPTAALAFGVSGCSHIAGIYLYSISSKSMEPTLHEGDKVTVDQRYYASHALKDGDIIVLKHNEFVLAKRVSALPGETIEGRNSVLIRNGRALTETYIAPLTGNGPPEIATFPKRQVAHDEIFVTGDNREQSLDSRSTEFGAVHREDVLGKVVSVYASSHGNAHNPL